MFYNITLQNYNFFFFDVRNLLYLKNVQFKPLFINLAVNQTK